MFKHVFTNGIADGTNTQVVRPSDWNSAHNIFQTIAGNTAGTSAISGSDIVYQGGNNITLSATGSTIIFSGPSLAPYLTTAAQSDHSHGNPTLALTNLSGTTASNSNGFTLSLSAGAGGAGDGVNILAAGTQTANTTGTVLFNNANGITFGMSNSSVITASHNGLTTAAQSDHSHGNPTLALTNLTGTTASNSNGFTLSLSAGVGGAGDGYNILAAGTQTAGTANTVQFLNSNGISFGMSNSSQITASYTVPPAQTVQPVAYSAANGSANFSTLTFANSNGVSFSTGTQGLYATVKTDYLTTARASNDAIGLNTALTANGVSVTANSSGLSLNFPAFLTTAAQSSVSNVSAVYAGTASNGGTATLSGGVSFSNANGVSFYTSAGNAVVATVKTDYLTTGALSDHSHGNPTLALTNLTGTTASASNGFTLSLSAAAPGAGGGIAAAAGTQTATSGTIVFANSNGMTFGMSQSSQITGSYTVPSVTEFATAAHIEGNTVGNSSAAFAGSAIHLQGGANITLSGTGSTVIISAPNPGGGAAISQRWMAGMDFPPVLVNVTNVPGVSLQEMLFPFHIDGTLTASELMWQMSRSTSGSNLFSVHVGIYTFVNSTQISLLGSNSHSFSATATASVSGIRQFEVSMGTNMSTLVPGDYVLGVMFSAAATASMNYSLMGNSVANPAVGVVLPGADQYSTATTHQYVPFWGRYATSSAALQGSIGVSQVIGGFTGASLPLPVWFNLGY